MQTTHEDLPGILLWLRERAVNTAHLRTDSRAVMAGDVFIALAGRHTDGLQYLGQALQRGAAAALVDAQAWAGVVRGAADMPPAVLPVPALARQLPELAARYYGMPGTQLRTIGITGTNGKTSSCQWIGQLLSGLGQPCATIGTLGFGMDGTSVEEQTGLTTPDAVSLQRLARRALDAGAHALALEVSSIGIDQGRVDAMPCEFALFTNLSRDHLDYHGDMAVYGAVKKRLFTRPGLRHAVLNIDDELGRELALNLQGQGLEVTGYGVGGANTQHLMLARHLRAEDIEHRPEGMRIAVVCESADGPQRATVEAPMLGEFNVLNLLGVLGVALAFGYSLPRAAQACARLQPPPGRLQRVDGSGAAEPLVIVDYAHTPDAVAKALQALRPLARARHGRLWIVFGAGGDRDAGKRPTMGAVAAAGADVVVITSDNPRSESAEAIIGQIAAGIPAGAAFSRNPDRAAAIQNALLEAGAADVVLIAGKGHESYQEIAGRRMPFSDVEVAGSALRARAGATR